jgi:hypothetical protein
MIAQTIQLALAPVFVLVAIGHLLNTLSARLSRVADRARDLQDRYDTTTGAEHDNVVALIRATDRRIVLIGRSVMAMVLSGLCIGIDVAVLFVDEMLRLDLQRVVGALFLAAIALLMWGLVLFLRETQVATNALRIPMRWHAPRSD